MQEGEGAIMAGEEAEVGRGTQVEGEVGAMDGLAGEAIGMLAASKARCCHGATTEWLTHRCHPGCRQ